MFIIPEAVNNDYKRIDELCPYEFFGFQVNHITDYGVTLLVESASVRLKLVVPEKRNCVEPLDADSGD